MDAFEFMDLHAGYEKRANDVVREFLQKRLPASLLDRRGMERRELDTMEARKELPSGGSIHYSRMGRRGSTW